MNRPESMEPVEAAQLRRHLAESLREFTTLHPMDGRAVIGAAMGFLGFVLVRFFTDAGIDAQQQGEFIEWICDRLRSLPRGGEVANGNEEP